MIDYKIGDRVRFINADRHKDVPQWFPPVGTVGIVGGMIGEGYQTNLVVQWPNGATSREGEWVCEVSDVEPVKGEESEMKENVSENTMSRNVYVCYEENGGEIASENGAIDMVKVCSNVDKAVKFIMDAVTRGMENGFIVDEVYGEVTADRLYTELSERDATGITLFHDHQDNWDRSYDVIVRRMQVEE